MSSFANMKKNSQTDFQRLQKDLEKQKSGKGNYQEDPRFWKLTRDKADVGSATIRFLSAPEGETDPVVRYYDHHFQGKGGWFVENCPRSIGLPCPVCDANKELYDEAGENKDHPSRKIAKDRKGKLNYVCNVLIVSDPANRENEGKVFLYKFGKMIFDKILAVMNNTDPDEPTFNPFDMWKGANFKLKSHNDSDFVTYKESKFALPGPMCNGDDDEIEKVWKKSYKLQDFKDPSRYLSYEELDVKFQKVIRAGAAGSQTRAESATPTDVRNKAETNVDTEIQKRFGSAPAPETSSPPFSPTKPGKPNVEVDEETKSTAKYFASLAEED